MGIVLSLSLLSAQPAIVSYCEAGMRGDPVMRVEHSGNRYSIYFMPNQWEDCRKYAAKFQFRDIDIVCGCKQLKFDEQKDRLRLSCVSYYYGKVHHKRIATYFYYNDSIPHCHRLRDALMRN